MQRLNAIAKFHDGTTDVITDVIIRPVVQQIPIACGLLLELSGDSLCSMIDRSPGRVQRSGWRILYNI